MSSVVGRAEVDYNLNQVFLSLPLGPERLIRPSQLVRYEFAHQGTNASIIPIEAVAGGDTQVLAAREAFQDGTTVINLDVLSGFPSVESVVASTRIEATRPLPNIKELLLHPWTPMPSAETLRNLPNLEVLYAWATHGRHRLDLGALNGPRMRKLAFNRWLTNNVEALDNMTGLQRLAATLFREPLDAVGRMSGMRHLTIRGPARGWSKLADCTLLEEAHLIDVQVANLKRWNRWKQLRVLILSGRGIKSLEGMEAFQNLETLTLLNTRTDQLSPLRKLPRLRVLTLRMPAAGVDLESIAAIPGLRVLTIDDDARLPTLKPLEKAPALEEVSLTCIVEDGDLTPVAGLPGRRDIRVLDSRIEVHPPQEGMTQWSLFESLAERLNLETNYAAEKMIRREVRKRDPALVRRLDWDTEAGAVGIFADNESDMRTVADLVNELVQAASKAQHKGDNGRYGTRGRPHEDDDSSEGSPDQSGS
jgi:hypothetical protein